MSSGSIHRWTVGGEQPEKTLASLMRRDLSVTVDPNHLRLFILHNWKEVQACAHGIHEIAIMEAGPTETESPA